MINLQNIIVELLNKGKQELSEDKEVMVRLSDVVSVLNEYNVKLEAVELEAKERRSQAMKQAWAQKEKKGDKKKAKK